MDIKKHPNTSSLSAVSAVSRSQTAEDRAADDAPLDVLEQGVSARGLSPRQIEVLQAVADAATIVIAARQLGVKPSTINNHLRKMRKTLDLDTTCQMVAWGFRKGVLK